MSAGIIMIGVAVAILIGFIVFYRYSQTETWERSDTRKAMLNAIVAVGPLLGMHYNPPRPALPGIMTPGPEKNPATGQETESEPDQEAEEDPPPPGEPRR